MAACAITGTIKDLGGNAIQDVRISARLLGALLLADNTTVMVPKEVYTTTAVDGTFTLTVEQAASVIFTVSYPPSNNDTRRILTYSSTIPSTTTANFSQIITLE